MQRNTKTTLLLMRIFFIKKYEIDRGHVTRNSQNGVWFQNKNLCNLRKNVNSIKTSEGIDLVLGCIVLNGQTYNIFNITSENCLDMGCNHHGHFVVFIFYCQNSTQLTFVFAYPTSHTLFEESALISINKS